MNKIIGIQNFPPAQNFKPFQETSIGLIQKHLSYKYEVNKKEN